MEEETLLEISFSEQFKGIHRVQVADPEYPSAKKSSNIEDSTVSQNTTNAGEGIVAHNNNNSEPVEYSTFLKRNKAALELIEEQRGWELTAFDIDVEDSPLYDQECIDRVSDSILRLDRITGELCNLINSAEKISAEVAILTGRTNLIEEKCLIIFQRDSAIEQQLNELETRFLDVEKRVYDTFFLPTCAWNRFLNWDITKMIARWLDGPSAKNFALVCKSFANAVNQRARIKISPKIEGLNLLILLSSKPQLKSLCLPDCKKIGESELLSIVRSYPKLINLNLDRCKAVNGKVLNEIATYCRHIESLSICSTDNQISPDELILFLRKCPNLRNLDTKGNPRLTSDEMLTLIQSINPQLEVSRGYDPHKSVFAGLTGEHALLGMAAVGIGLLTAFVIYMEHPPRANHLAGNNNVDSDDEEA